MCNVTTKIFVPIRNLEMYKCIDFHTSVPKLQGDIQRSNNLYIFKALFVVPALNSLELFQNPLANILNILLDYTINTTPPQEFLFSTYGCYFV